MVFHVANDSHLPTI